MAVSGMDFREAKAMNKCPACDCKGQFLAHVNTGPDSSGHYWGDVDCLTCRGAGTVTDEHLTRIEAGRQLRAERIAQGIPLSIAAKMDGITVVEHCKLERGGEPCC